MAAKPSKLEGIKADSAQLRGTLADQIREETTHFDETGKQLLKFHGLYQQDDRDMRSVNRAAGRDKAYSFMLRTRIPGGGLTAEQYLVHDDLATRYANNTLRITTRQCFQFHGVLKGDVTATIRELNHALVTSLGACGDLVRNVMCCPAPVADPLRAEIAAITREISDHLLPRTRAYHELWLDGEKVHDGRATAEEEPVYGKTYLPRKFKIAIAYPGDNCVDIYTQDIGLVAVADAGRLVGFNLIAGGGMGMNHTKPDTFPRLGDHLGFVTAEQVVTVVEAIVLIQRDHGNRSDRKYARMKYLIHAWGIERFKAELESRLGYALAPFRTMPPLENDLHLGWQDQGNGRLFLGLSVENGRIADVGDLRLKSGLRALVERFRPEVRLTPNHDILLANLQPGDRPAVEALLAEYGIRPHEELSMLQLYSMACVAFPTCGLAIAESERALPAIIDQLETKIAALGLEDERITVRMTGCPNGCARPYVADIAFVGRAADQYRIFVGGRNDGTRLNEPYLDLVHLDDLVVEVTALLAYFKATRTAGERFGDFCARMGGDALRRLVHQQSSVHQAKEDVDVTPVL